MKSLAIAIAVTFVIIALSLFFVMDKDQAVATTITPANTSIGSVESMVGGLEQRLQQQPADGKGWLLLAKSYRHLGRMDDARNAYAKAEALGNGDAIVAAQLDGVADNGVSQ